MTTEASQHPSWQARQVAAEEARLISVREARGRIAPRGPGNRNPWNRQRTIQEKKKSRDAAIKQTALLASMQGKHPGSTIIVVGNGPSLLDIPTEWLKAHLTFGSNWLHLTPGLDDWRPNYYATGDGRVMERWDEIVAWLGPKTFMFLPTPNLDNWGTVQPNLARFKRDQGNGSYVGKSLDPVHAGISYSCISHISAQLAAFLGAERVVLVGCDGDAGGDTRQHSYGLDEERAVRPQQAWSWAQGWQKLRAAFCVAGVELQNASTVTSIDTLPRVDWRDV